MAADILYRTGIKNYCTCDIVDGKDVKEETLICWGYLTRNRAEYRLRKKYKNPDILVKSIKSKKIKGCMTMEEFFENCTVIEENDMED